ncbi:hypothetical protein LCGC14_2296760 [marine sediment metagenome]|uniref:Uncharacterized protein n=1 Tax=marine sediment metagenome TaxID=412755 RepID=A0A0F9CQ78_9ZZZZ
MAKFTKSQTSEFKKVNKLASTLYKKGDMESYNDAQRAAQVIIDNPKLIKKQRGMKP